MCHKITIKYQNTPREAAYGRLSTGYISQNDTWSHILPGATDRIAAGIRAKIRHSLYRFRRIRQDHRHGTRSIDFLLQPINYRGASEKKQKFRKPNNAAIRLPSWFKKCTAGWTWVGAMSFRDLADIVSDSDKTNPWSDKACCCMDYWMGVRMITMCLFRERRLKANTWMTTRIGIMCSSFIMIFTKDGMSTKNSAFDNINYRNTWHNLIHHI